MGEIEGVCDEQCDSMSVIQESTCDERYKEQLMQVQWLRAGKASSW